MSNILQVAIYLTCAEVFSDDLIATLMLSFTVKNYDTIRLHYIFMAALRSRHYIFALWFLSIFYLFFIPRLISAAADWMSTILPHMVWP